MSEPTYPDELAAKTMEWSELVTQRLLCLTDELEKVVGEMAEIRHALAVEGIMDEVLR